MNAIRAARANGVLVLMVIVSRRSKRLRKGSARRATRERLQKMAADPDAYREPLRLVGHRTKTR